MRGSAAFRVGVAPGGALAPSWVRDSVSRAARSTPSLDLRFADNKSLIDATSGQSLVTFTRASSGTFVGSDGVIKTATTNLLLRSEEFDNASWIKLAATVNANAETSPFGSLAADKLVETTAASSYHYILQACSYAPQTTFSIFAKKGERSVLRLQTGGDNYGADFNLNTGATGNLNNVASVSMVSVGNGWYRCSITTSNTVALNGILIILNSAGFNTPVYTGDGTSGIYLWGAQLEQSSTVGEYIPTTSAINSAPRFDHNPTTGESLGLLVEEQRTNLIVQSENFETTWLTTGLLAFGSGSTLNATVAPDGQTTADLLTENSSTSEHRVETAAISWVANTTYTLTLFAKANGRTRMDVFGVGGGNFTGGRNASFNLSTGAVITTDGAVASIEARANAYYRIRMTFTASAAPSASALFIRFLDNSNNFSYAGDGTSGIYLWGAQLEAGAFPTSYIPTTSATVTRSTDVASITGANFSSWYRQDEGTVFSDCLGTFSATQVLCNLGAATNTTGSSSIAVASNLESSQKRVRVRDAASATQATLALGASSSSSRTKIAAAIKQDDFAASLDGGSAVTDASGTVPTVSLLDIGCAPAGVTLGLQTHRRLTYWPVRLANNVLQEITR